MKPDRTYLFIAISSIALVMVLVIQVNWILETANMKEEIFNEKAGIVLSKTAQILSTDTTACSNMKVGVSFNEKRKIDSLFNHYMKIYNIHIDYCFEVKPNFVANGNSVYQPNCYQTSIGESENNGLGLKLIFPKKEEFIIAEMGSMFISSVILILLVFVISWRTILSLIKEKKIATHTRDFLNNMTHEFKTPLTNIALARKMIMKDSSIAQEDKIKHYSGIILEENEKLRLQVEQVLSMTAIERGEIPLHKTELDLHQLIQDYLKCINIQIENKQGSVTLKMDADRFVVMGDKTHLTNAFCNLIDNAIKYSDEKPELTIQTSNTGTHIIIRIIDKGIGIEKEYHKKIFDKIFRVPKGDIHDVKGFGLGLAYTKRIFDRFTFLRH